MVRSPITRNTKLEDLPEWLAPREIMDWFGLGRNTVYDLLRTGTIPSRRFGKKILVSKRALS